MVTACENLATKQELEELKEQLNALLGKAETGEPVNVLAQGNFEGTLVGEQLEFAKNSVQDIKFQDVNGAIVTNFDDNSLEQLVGGALTIIAFKGKDLIVPLKVLTKSVAVRASKIITNIGIGKLATAAGALTTMSGSTIVSLLMIITSLAQSIANLQVLAARIDREQQNALALDRSIRDNFQFTAKNTAQIKKNEKIAHENKKTALKNEKTLQEIKQTEIDIKADIEKNNQDIAEAENMILNFESEFVDFKAKVEAYEGEVTEEIEKLNTNIAILEENLEISEANFEKLKKTTQELGEQLAFAEGKITELEIDTDRLKIQSTLNVVDIIQLKKDLSDHKIISKSKIKGLSARLVLLEDNMSNIEDIESGFPFLPFPVQEQIADTQNKTLVLANSLSSNPADVDELAISPGAVLNDNSFTKLFDQIVQGINIGDLGATDVNIPELAAQISGLITPDINTNINTNFDNLGLPNIAKDIVDIKENTSTPNLTKTVEKAATDSICNSTQGQGCLAQNIGNPINQTVKDTAKTIGEILDKLKDLLDDETLERVKDIQEKINQEGENATLDKTILAATYIHTLHNAALLSTNVDQTVNWVASQAYEALELKNYQGEEIDPKQWTNARLNEADQASETTNKSKIEQENRLNHIAPVTPESWQVKVGSDRPQLVVIYKPKSQQYSDPTSRWQLTIPHPNLEVKTQDFIKLIPDYNKGNTYGILILNDNSKITVNAKNEAEAKKTIEQMLSKNLINPKLIPEKYFIKTGNMATNFKELEVTPSSVKFFSKGQQNNTPDWIVFSNN